MGRLSAVNSATRADRPGSGRFAAPEVQRPHELVAAAHVQYERHVAGIEKPLEVTGLDPGRLAPAQSAEEARQESRHGKYLQTIRRYNGLFVAIR